MDTKVGQVINQIDERINSNTMSLADDQEISSPLLVTSSQPSTEFNELLVENLGGKERVTMKNFTASYRRFFDQNFGPVSHFYVVKNHYNWQSKGYGFVTFEHSSDAQKALNASEEQLTVDVALLMGNRIRGPFERTLKVSPAKGTLRSRVRSFLEDRREFNNQKVREREELVSQLISGKAVRETPNEEKDYGSNGFHSLTDEIIRTIFINLDSVELSHCESVCRRWNNIIQDIRQCKQSLFIYRIHKLDQPMEFNEHIFSILKKYPKLKELGIARSYYVDEVTVEIIGQCCPELEEISSIYSAAALVEDLTEHCPGLKAIDFHNWPHLRDKTLCEFLKVAHNLKDLNLSGRNQITGECFSELPKLEKLDIQRCRKLRVSSMTKLAQKCHSSLRVLKVGPISSEALKVVWESFPNLHTLELQNTYEYNLSKVFKIVPRFGKLETLHIHPHNEINDEEFIKFIESCRSLKELRLPDSSFLSDEGISKIADFCKNLKCLNISGSDISDLGIASLSRLNFLEKLCLARTRVTDGGLKGILTGCSNLHSLDVDGCDAVTVATLLTAYDLKTQALLHHQLVIKYRGASVKMSSMRNEQDIHDLGEELDYISEASDCSWEDIDEDEDSCDSCYGNIPHNFFNLDDSLDHFLGNYLFGYFEEDDSDEFYDEDDIDDFYDEDDPDEFDGHDSDDLYDEENFDELDDEHGLYSDDSDEFDQEHDLDGLYDEEDEDDENDEVDEDGSSEGNTSGHSIEHDNPDWDSDGSGAPENQHLDDHP
ncbi:uncharacterized protein LOC141853344 [Brevipalpus obovatus]|uniref:uncharacterized protein LOC141853344 n=1 Tax=Brevipalpus obovatus TaxID=246614 RepID=UPI003D9F784E